MQRHARSLMLAAVAVVCLCRHDCPRGSAADQPSPKPGPRAWNLKEAMAQLALSPHDAYMQYVALQLARRQNASAAAAGAIEQMLQSSRWEATQGRVDLFSLFTGALAV